MRSRLPPWLLGRRASLVVEDVVELVADALEPVREIDLLLYGSTVEAGRVIGDIDLWLSGTPECVQAAIPLLQTLAQRRALPIDVARAVSENPELDAATRWCVGREGKLIRGRQPEPPPISEAQAEAAYRSAVERRARAYARQADVLARVGIAATAEFVEAALRSWVRSLASDRHEERVLKRLSTNALLPRIQPLDPPLFELLRENAWGNPTVARAVLERLA